MSVSALRDEIHIELESMNAIVGELIALQLDLEKREPSVREKTAAAAFLSQFYNGLENILKRISCYNGVPLPDGETWHIELFQRFSSPAYSGLPELFNTQLAAKIAPYRRFRHVAFHSYGFQLDWMRMKEGVDNIHKVFNQIKSSLAKYLKSVERTAS